LRGTYNPKQLTDFKVILIIKKEAEFLVRERYSDLDGNGNIDSNKINERRYHDLKNFISQSLIISPAGGPPIEPNGPILKAIMLECMKLMNVDNTHRDYVVHMAKDLKTFRFHNQYVNEAILEFKKAADLNDGPKNRK
jgi:hypothetical protein